VIVLTVIRDAIESTLTLVPVAMAVAIAVTNVVFHVAKLVAGNEVITNVPCAAFTSVDPDVTLGVVVVASGQLTRPHVNLQSPAKVGETHEQPVAGAAQSAGVQVVAQAAVLQTKVRSPVHVLDSTPAAVAHRRV